MANVIVPRLAAVRAGTLDDCFPLSEVGLQIGMIAVDPGVDNRDVRATARSSIVDFLGVDSVDSPGARLLVQIYLSIFLDISDIVALLESLPCLLGEPSGNRLSNIPEVEGVPN
jgi:hypothetical protein